MKHQCALLSCLILLSLLSGCTFWSSETSVPAISKLPRAHEKASKKIPMQLVGFGYEYYGPTGSAVTNATVYNFGTNSTSYGTGITTTYGWKTSGIIRDSAVNTMESEGYNVRSSKPMLVLSGNSRGTGIDFSHFWSDLGINVLGAITLGSIGSSRYTGESELAVYSPDGRRVGYYYRGSSWNYKLAGTPFATLFSQHAYRNFTETKAAIRATHLCLLEFLYDLKTGKYDEYLPDEYKVLKNVEKMEQEKAKESNEDPEYE